MYIFRKNYGKSVQFSGALYRKCTYILRLPDPLGDCDLSTLTRLGTHFTYVSRISSLTVFSHTKTHWTRARASFVLSYKWRHLEIRRTGDLARVAERYFPCLRRGKWREGVFHPAGTRRRLFLPKQGRMSLDTDHI